MLELLECFKERHPLYSMIVFQIVIGAGLVASVGGITFAGAGILWMFCHMVGMM